MQAGSYQPRKVCHICPQIGANLVRNLPEGFKIFLARVGRPARNNHFGAILQGRIAHLIHIYPATLFIYLVGGGVIKLTREIDFHAVGQMPTVI